MANTNASILVVTDAQATYDLLAPVLSARGHRLTPATATAQTLQRLELKKFDLIIVEIASDHGVQGLELLGQLNRGGKLPVLVIAGNTAHLSEALDLGASDFLVKPFDNSALLARVHTVLAHKQTRDQLRQTKARLDRHGANSTPEKPQSEQRQGVELLLRSKLHKHKRIESELRALETHYRELYHHTPAISFTVDAQGVIRSANRFGTQYLGYAPQDLIGLPMTALFEPGEGDAVMDRLAQWLQKPKAIHRRECRILRKDGSSLWVRKTSRAITDPNDEPIVLMVCEDITDTRLLSEKLSYQASHDDLTGLVNRREFKQRLNRALKNAKTTGAEHALCYLDLDQFKVINDACGHIAGDELLRQLAKLLQQGVRNRDTLARLGGDEFGILLEHCSLEQASKLADAFREAISNFRFTWKNQPFGVGVSIGLVPITGESNNLVEVLSAADAACYEAKESGRNRIKEYNQNDTSILRRHDDMQLVLQVDRALKDGRFELYYQPIETLQSIANEGDHYELLIRMIDEHGRVIRPAAFLPAAERFDLALRLDRWVICTAFEWLVSHPEHLDRLALCSINLSGHSMADEGLHDYIIAQFDNTGMPAEKICFEITETAAIANLAKATRFMAFLKELGCLFALDDFGSGTSSFKYLKNLPVDHLKIDGAFVKGMTADPMDLAMVRSINELGHVMGKKTVAEFVDNEATLEQLRDMGVDYAQGYYLGHPSPVDTLTVESTAIAKKLF